MPSEKEKMPEEQNSADSEEDEQCPRVLDNSPALTQKKMEKHHHP